MIKGLEKMDVNVLMEVHKRGGVIPNRLTTDGVCTPNYILKVIKRLLDKELVTKKKVDGRANKLIMTPKGTSIANQIKKLHKELNG